MTQQQNGRVGDTMNLRVRRKITDCDNDGCGECDVCKRLGFLEWARMVSSGIPHEIEQNKEVDDYIKEKYGV